MDDNPSDPKAIVLVVEDDDGVRESTVWVLRSLGYATLEAADGPAALDLLETDKSIDLLFSDIVMPKGMSGIDLAQQAIHSQSGLKVLLTTGYAESDVGQLSESGLKLLPKPYRNEDLAKSIDELLSA
ncbi:MAG: response regulator [Rhodospirillales bacterium]|nr:response regulator [Rhodospirillales bacterium]